MRLIANSHNSPEVKRIMLAPETSGCFVFLFDSVEDCPSFADHWYDSLQDAKKFCLRNYGVPIDEWTEIPDASEGSMQDRIAVVPIAKRKST
ncbi:MAG: hypothetical protein J5I99_06575 [Verrucomicrobia bacterium]|nr:hypothetical protein [Verrucomicrobiota bacterium]